MISTSRRVAPEHGHPYAHHDPIGRKRSRSFAGPVAVPLGSAYSDPPRSSHRRSASSHAHARAPFHPPVPAPSSSHGHGHERGRHGSIGRHHPDFASVVPANIASSAADPYAREHALPSSVRERPHASRRATWQGPPSAQPFAPSLKVHRALACTARSPALLYDVTHAPSHLNILAPPSSSLLASLTRRRTVPTPVPAHTLALPATRPFVPELHLALPTLPGVPPGWAVRAMSMGDTESARTALTNLDVLHAVYAALRTPASRREWDALGAGSTAQKRVAEAYKRRCETLGSQREWDAGVRRVDFLCGRTVLWGVECRADGVCELVFAKPQ
ncbi:hypothetical protein M0805_002343 [Coniferiporia weirii]|nr:hypothetical protein M0805_002343 [Coniferiporia weirii]